ncbi:YbhB/YbcL family Raf kinase inhibitor-like protein [Methanolobus zinderi]|uniref:YbhB/YbcL family Raf kinase inhibitor-like protein n=1 Tax=Methanolobus zinderi TaxID=536044 RepID=A0A7D5EDB3_9EURY|nr:YbhB/YbcL family Raf kinase inhibitor-like protein [Methanolobus zinderi]QLC49354.1 YbhB/YbcL family Raf kinase inhibitor-like protein [Methanolobus zinderi]
MISRNLSGFVIVLMILTFVSLVSGCIADSSNESQEEPDRLINESDGDIQNNSGEDDIMITSSAFEDGDKIPAKYTCDGENVNPPFEFENLPEATKSLVLIITDPDAPSGNFVHWAVWNIIPESGIEENSVPGVVGRNSYGKASYTGPCPPSGTHEFVFRVFALDTELELEGGSKIDELEQGMQGHVLAEGKLTALYGRA